MGLAGAKNKKKWAQDPNNNAWSRNTDTFAQKIMRSQGWAPGDYLGAKDATHSEYFGAANASHIKAVLKDDNMGLGAKRNGGDECVGLFDFQALLGRLNGQSEESLDEQRQKRDDARLNMYLHRKLGTVRFVFGGFLVGDKVQELVDEVQREKDAAANADADGTTDTKKDRKSKKRKAEVEVEESTVPEKKKSKKSKTEDADGESKARRREKKEKRRQEKDASKDDSTEPKNAEPDNTKAVDADEASSSRKKEKKDKKEKRDKKEKKEKEKRKQSEDDVATPADNPELMSEKKKKRRADKEAEAASSIPSALPTPTASGTATPVPHRHLARQRFIAQKRAAVMDQAALNQIFMIKT